MAQLIVRNLDDDVATRLKRRAKRTGRSMEDEVRHILRNATKQESRTVRKLGSRIAARFKKLGLALDVPEVRTGPARPVDFDQ